jgi:DNA-binding FadR family transcriptional regulator
LFHYSKLSVVELIQTRLLIECDIARAAALNVQAQFVRRLQDALKAERNERVSHADFVTSRIKVHHILAEMSGNRLLEAIANSLFRLTGELILVVKPAKKVIHRPEEHAEIIRAVLSHDADGAARAMQRHLENMATRLIKLEGSYRKKKGLTG